MDTSGRAEGKPEADHVRLLRDRDRGGEARPDRPGRPGAPACLAGAVRRPGRRRVRAGGVYRLAVRRGGAGGRRAAHVAEPADTAFARGRKRHAKTGRTDSRHLRELLAEGRLPECWIPPPVILECRALLETYHDLRAEHTAWVQRIHAVFFHQGAPALGEAALRTDRDLQALRAAAACSPVTGRAAAGGHRAGHAGRAAGPPGRAAAPAAGCRPGPDRGEGAGRPAVRGRPGHRAGDDLLAGRRRPVLLLPPGGPVRRAGRHRLVLGPQGPARAAVPAGPGGAAWAVYRPARPTPAPRPPTTTTTRRSRTARAASGPPCPRPARSSGRPATSWPSSATTRSPPPEPGIPSHGGHPGAAGRAGEPEPNSPDGA